MRNQLKQCSKRGSTDLVGDETSRHNVIDQVTGEVPTSISGKDGVDAALQPPRRRDGASAVVKDEEVPARFEDSFDLRDDPVLIRRGRQHIPMIIGIAR